MNTLTIDILLSTYNGSTHIDEQIASLISQTDTNWRLMVRDDGSTDGTLSKLEAWTKKDKRITLISDELGNLKPAKSFIHLISYSTGDIFMFCDQDDVWHADKVAIFRKEMQQHSPKTPTLIYSDVTVVDSHLSIVGRSFHTFQGFKHPKHSRLSYQLIHNVVIGCASAGNRALADKIKGCPADLLKNVIMHDWWLANLTLLVGTLQYIDKPTVNYRVHQGNSIGAKGPDIKQALIQKSKIKKAQNHLKKCQKQAEILQELTKNNISARQDYLLNLMINNKKPHTLFSLLKCFYNGIRMTTLIRNLGLIAAVVFSEKSK